MNIGQKVTTNAHDYLALDYHGLEGVVTEKKVEDLIIGSRIRKKRPLCWVEFCGAEYERRSAEMQASRRLCRGLWIDEEALSRTLA